MDDFANLLAQADELLKNGHCLAAGVICRAVFQAHLCKLYGIHYPWESGEPTIEVIVQALTESEVLTKIAVMNVEVILRQGNHCAHNLQPPLKEILIRGLIQKVRNFLIQHPFK